MPNPSPEEFTHVKKLVNEGKKEEALEFVKKFSFRALNLNTQGEVDKALEIALSCEELLLEIGSLKHIADNNLLICRIYRRKRNMEAALKYCNKALGIHKKIGHKMGLASSLSLLGHLYWDQRKYDQAMKVIEQSHSIKEISPVTKVQNLADLGAGYVLWGELSKALEYCEEAIIIAEEANLIGFCPYILYTMGLIYLMKGEYEQSEVKAKKGLRITEKIDYNQPLKGSLLLVLIWLQLIKNSVEGAKNYLTILEKFAEQNENLQFLHIFFIGKGMILQTSSKMQERAEAEKLFKQVVDSEVVEKEFSRLFIYPYALYFLCDLLIEELGNSNDIGNLNEINTYISRLDDLGIQADSQLLRTEAQIFQARVALIQLNLGEARILLTQAQNMAETHNLQYFAQIISNNHDRLLEQQEVLEQLKKRDAPISERIKYTAFDSVLTRLKRKDLTESSELISETPVLLLIIAKGGTLIFSKDYAEDLSIESDLISSFLSAFESFGDELFSERLDRIKYGENTILLKPLENFSVCYLFKGQSYPALQKLTRFAEAIKENSEIWRVLNKSVTTSEMLELDKHSALKTVIDEIFIK
ncbi:MAG: tetratricopeptide repeat protein [Promethearchaeota archaeon]|jgi:tetratricopeptide (TPR) repeat protein